MAGKKKPTTTVNPDVQEVNIDVAVITAEADKAVALLNPIEVKLNELLESSKDVKVADLDDKEGAELAHQHLMQYVSTRTSITKGALALREPLNKAAKAIIAKEKELLALIEPEEKRLKEERDSYYNELERKKQEAIESKRLRLQNMSARLLDLGFIFNGTLYVLADELDREEVTDTGLELMDDEEFARLEVRASLISERIAKAKADATRKEQEEKERQERESKRLADEAERQRLKEEEQAKKQAELDAREAKMKADEEAKRIADEARAKAEETAAKAIAAAKEEADRIIAAARTSAATVSSASAPASDEQIAAAKATAMETVNLSAVQTGPSSPAYEQTPVQLISPFQNLIDHFELVNWPKEGTVTDAQMTAVQAVRKTVSERIVPYLKSIQG
jgi:hypothetical protein